ncbi:aminotransferase class V-fold PLP-dependent enzyme [Mycobacterium gordonae]|uniref:Aminotransferase class V n=1 Tax=Mycobacterium gordonae TaxID=1778 RepID=A0A1X1VYA0_MYCGO|nr:aminotransferase class V-fold PLP-dependent enzyme [Mycobacterium gordonae]MCV7008653.1 aminotransferase class V-fold PLP-dependent enzyme [Mycobacterium gordonae]ORV74860.1 aminotransferase class V [Mycobacterium gordonae]
MREAFGEKFDVPAGYLDTAAIGLPFARVADTLVDTIAHWRAGALQVTDFDADVVAARNAWAQLVGVAPLDVVTGASVSQLVGLLAASVPDGTKVLTVHNEFTSVTFPFAAQQRRGITVTEARPAELLSQLRRHDLVAISAVQSADGFTVDLDELRAAAEAARVRVLLDVSQAAGWQQLRLHWAEFVVGAAYKWLLAPRGAAWMAVRRDVLADVVPQAANWSGAEDIWSGLYGLPLRLADNARRLDLSPVWFSQRGAAIALPWLAGLDLSAVRQHCVGLANATLAGLGLDPCNSAIISLGIAAEAAHRLVQAGAAISMRAGRVRLSFHLYNTMEDVELVLSALR